MQTDQFPFKKSIWLLLLPVFSFLIITSCKEKAPDGTCISLSKSKIKKAWVTPGHMNSISYFKLITFYNPINNDIKVSAQAYTSAYQPIGDLVKLTTGKKCDTLPALLVGVNFIYKDSMNIIDSSGNLKDFEYIQFTPGVYYYQCDSTRKIRILNFGTKVMKDATTVNALSTLPCPPCINCKPPDSCPVSED